MRFAFHFRLEDVKLKRVKISIPIKQYNELERISEDTEGIVSINTLAFLFWYGYRVVKVGARLLEINRKLAKDFIKVEITLPED